MVIAGMGRHIGTVSLPRRRAPAAQHRPPSARSTRASRFARRAGGVRRSLPSRTEGRPRTRLRSRGLPRQRGHVLLS
eukprot:1910764-Prymnesium_polylepis.1